GAGDRRSLGPHRGRERAPSWSAPGGACARPRGGGRRGGGRGAAGRYRAHAWGRGRVEAERRDPAPVAGRGRRGSRAMSAYQGRALRTRPAARKGPPPPWRFFVQALAALAVLAIAAHVPWKSLRRACLSVGD